MRHGAKRWGLACAGVACGLLAGASGAGSGRALAAPEGSAQTGQLKPEGSTMSETSTTMTTTGTIKAIDRDKRTVTVTQDNGQDLTVKVPPEAKNFDRLKTGQGVRLAYYESTAVSVLPPGAPEPSRQEQRAYEGRRGRGGIEARQVTATVQVLRVDPANHTVAIKDPDGFMRTVKVENKQIAQKLHEIKPGDTVQLTYTEAVAASLVPMEKQQR
jgi:hypothetical protein